MTAKWQMTVFFFKKTIKLFCTISIKLYLATATNLSTAHEVQLQKRTGKPRFSIQQSCFIPSNNRTFWCRENFSFVPLNKLRAQRNQQQRIQSLPRPLFLGLHSGKNKIRGSQCATCELVQKQRGD